MSDGTSRLNQGPEGPTPDVWVVARQEGRELARVRLSPGLGRETIVGSDESCDVRLSDSSVSRRHLSLRLRMGRVAARDLGSTNGTLYQGSKLTEALLPLGAALQLGRIELLLEPVRDERSVRFGPLESVCPPMMAVLEALAKVAPTASSLLLLGPTGTGKDVCARAVHAASPRAAGQFETVDCGALPADVAAGELFGHERGAFSGADRSRAGLLERASGGTLFLDEVGELSLELQPLLLRVLEAREVRRLGSNQPTPIDVRVIAATHRDLEAQVAAGRFREDLFHRLAVVRVTLPSLAERLGDLPLLCRAVLDSLGERARGFSLSPEMLSALEQQPWPGNVRELRNFLERALALGARPSASAGGPDWPKDYAAARERAMDAFEREFALHLLKRHDGNVTKAAREAGIARTYLHKLIKRHGLDGIGR